MTSGTPRSNKLSQSFGRHGFRDDIHPDLAQTRSPGINQRVPSASKIWHGIGRLYKLTSSG